MAPLIHILILQFKADIGSEVVQKARQVFRQNSKAVWRANQTDFQAISGLLALKDTCLHPETQQAYIKNITGGKGTSPPGAGSQASSHPTLPT